MIVDSSSLLKKSSFMPCVICTDLTTGPFVRFTWIHPMQMLNVPALSTLSQLVTVCGAQLQTELGTHQKLRTIENTSLFSDAVCSNTTSNTVSLVSVF